MIVPKSRQTGHTTFTVAKTMYDVYKEMFIESTQTFQEFYEEFKTNFESNKDYLIKQVENNGTI